MNSGAAAMKGRNARLFASHRGWSSGIRPSLWIMVLSSLVARMEGGSTVGLRPNRWSAAPAGDAFGLFMGEGQYQAQVAAESAWNHGDVPSDVLSGFGDVSRARTFSPVTDSDSEMQQCSVSGGAIDWTSGPEYFSAQQQQPGFSFQGHQELESYRSFDSQLGQVFQDKRGHGGNCGGGVRRRGDVCGCSQPSETEQRRRLCGICGVMDATRGVAEDEDEGRWISHSCRHCAQFLPSTVSLSTRCTYCKRYATYGPLGGCRRQALHCKRHALSSEESVVGTRCLNLAGGFESGSLWGDDARRHNARQCSAERCANTASFGTLGGVPVSCREHCAADHVDLVHRKRCESPGCDKHPSFGLREEGVARYCRRHKPYQCVDLKARKCQYTWGCSKRPSFGDVSDGIPRFCMQHKQVTHLNVRSRKCSQEGCLRQPSFGGSDRIVRFCKSHRREGDVDLVHPRCFSNGCDKVPSYGPAHRPAVSCQRHKEPGHVSSSAHPKMHAAASSGKVATSSVSSEAEGGDSGWGEGHGTVDAHGCPDAVKCA